MSDPVITLDRVAVVTERCNGKEHRLPTYDVLVDGERVGAVRKQVTSEQRWGKNGLTHPVHPTKTVFYWREVDALYEEHHHTRNEAVEAVLRRV